MEDGSCPEVVRERILPCRLKSACNLNRGPDVGRRRMDLLSELRLYWPVLRARPTARLPRVFGSTRIRWVNGEDVFSRKGWTGCSMKQGLELPERSKTNTWSKSSR